MVRSLKGNIVTDWKKAPNLAHILFLAKQTNFEEVPCDPIIRGAVTRKLVFGTFLQHGNEAGKLKYNFTCFFLANIDSKCIKIYQLGSLVSF